MKCRMKGIGPLRRLKSLVTFFYQATPPACSFRAPPGAPSKQVRTTCFAMQTGYSAQMKVFRGNPRGSISSTKTAPRHRRLCTRGRTSGTSVQRLMRCVTTIVLIRQNILPLSEEFWQSRNNEEYAEDAAHGRRQNMALNNAAHCDGKKRPLAPVPIEHLRQRIEQ